MPSPKEKGTNGNRRLSKEVFLGIPKIFHVHKLSGGPIEGDWTEKSKVVSTHRF